MPRYSLLLKEVRACTHCAQHLPHGPRPVLQIHPNATLLIAAQAPGRKVHASGRPFTDVSGDRLRHWLNMSSDVFYDARRVAIVPMGFCYPGTSDGGDNPPRPECAVKWRSQVLKSLPNVKLTLVIGRYSQAYHLPKAGRSVTEIVQNWRDHWPNVIPLPHPSPRNIRWVARNPWFEGELLPALRSRIAELGLGMESES